MKKILLTLILLSVLAGNIFSQKQYITFGSTKISDSSNNTVFNRTIIANKNLFVKGYITMDTLGSAKIYYDGAFLQFDNYKTTGGYSFRLSEGSPQFIISKYVDGRYDLLATIDTFGIDLPTGANFMINGTPISGSGSSANLYGYAYKDSLNNFLQYNRFKHFTLYGSGADSVGFFVKGSSGDLMVTPVGSGVTFGSTHGTGTKNIYAGAYYIGDTILTSKTLTWDKRSYHTAADSSIITDELKGLTGQTYLTLKSPGDGNQQIRIGNTATDPNIYIHPSVASGYSYVFSTSGLGMNDIKLNWGTSSYGFVSDGNTYFQRNSSDNVGITTGGSERLNINNSSITSNVGLIVSGTSSYLTFPNLTSTQRDALTPAAGMVVFNTTVTKLQVYAGGTWVDLH